MDTYSTLPPDLLRFPFFSCNSSSAASSLLLPPLVNVDSTVANGEGLQCSLISGNAAADNDFYHPFSVAPVLEANVMGTLPFCEFSQPGTECEADQYYPRVSYPNSYASLAAGGVTEKLLPMGGYANDDYNYQLPDGPQWPAYDLSTWDHIEPDVGAQYDNPRGRIDHGKLPLKVPEYRPLLPHSCGMAPTELQLQWKSLDATSNVHQESLGVQLENANSSYSTHRILQQMLQRFSTVDKVLSAGALPGPGAASAGFPTCKLFKSRGSTAAANLHLDANTYATRGRPLRDTGVPSLIQPQGGRPSTLVISNAPPPSLAGAANRKRPRAQYDADITNCGPSCTSRQCSGTCAFATCMGDHSLFSKQPAHAVPTQLPSLISIDEGGVGASSRLLQTKLHEAAPASSPAADQSGGESGDHGGQSCRRTCISGADTVGLYMNTGKGKPKNLQAAARKKRVMAGVETLKTLVPGLGRRTYNTAGVMEAAVQYVDFLHAQICCLHNEWILDANPPFFNGADGRALLHSLLPSARIQQLLWRKGVCLITARQADALDYDPASVPQLISREK